MVILGYARYRRSSGGHVMLHSVSRRLMLKCYLPDDYLGCSPGEIINLLLEIIL